MPFDRPQHAVSPGLWALAWRRLRSDRVAMVSLAIVVAFLIMMILSGTGLIAGDWAKEVGGNYAPPTFVGAEEAAAPQAAATGTQAAPAASDQPTEVPEVQDPLADALAAIRGQGTPKAAAGDEGKSVD